MEQQETVYPLLWGGEGACWYVWSLEKQASSYLTAILIWGKLLVSVDTHNLTHEVQIPVE